MKNLLIITQKVDEADDLLGFFVSWIREFAGHFDRVDVITLRSGTYDLPANVHVHPLGKNRKTDLLRLLWRYTPKNGAVFSHMSPIFSVVAWPFARARRSKLVLWYLHRSVTARLKLAVTLCDVVVTADAASLGLKNPKIVSVGHGIDIQRFATNRDWNLNGRPLRLLLVGRISPIKGIETFIEAIKVVRAGGVCIDARVVGRPVMPGDFAYEKQLDHTAVEFVGFVPYLEMPAQYAWADIVVGCTPTGGIDKTLLEAMAAGCIVLTSNMVMRSYLEPYANQLLFEHGDAKDLPDKVQALREYGAISAAMVASVRVHHNLSATIEKISNLL